MSYINFESARVKDKLRNEKRNAREALLEKAEADYKRRKEREQRAAEKGEDKWMLPSLDAQLKPDSQKKKKSHKKEKKMKKEKKRKKEKKKSKKKDDSSDNSDSSDNEEWIEKGAQSSQTSANSEPVQRDEWMTLPALFPCVSRDQIQAQKRQETPLDKETLKKKFLLDNPGQSDRELNPFWKDGGRGLPQVEEPLPESLSLATNSAGDHGLAWLQRALCRVQEQAKEQGRSEEAVAAERWGSLEKLMSMLTEAECRCLSRPRDKNRGHGQRRGQLQGAAQNPREYEDWREDPTASAVGESAATQSEVVGDKARYRSWLGLKDPSPQQEPSSDDDFDYEQFDDPPVIEGLEIKEKSTMGKGTSNVSDKDVLDYNVCEEIDGKILFRSSKTRKENNKFSNPRLQTKNRQNPFERKFSEKNIRGKAKEMDSDEDDKLFEEWRNEIRSNSDDESKNKMDSILAENNESEKRSEGKQEMKYIEEKGDSDSRKIHMASSDDLRERFFQSRNRERLKNDVKEKNCIKDTKGNEYEEVKKFSNYHEYHIRKDDSLVVDNCKEKSKNRNEESKERRERREEREEYRDYNDRKREERELDRRKESDRERKESSFRDRRRNEDHKERGRQDKVRIEDREEKCEELRNVRRSEDSGQLSHKDEEREYKMRRRADEDESKDEACHRGSRDRQTGLRRTEIPDYISKHNPSPTLNDRPPRRLEGFQRPEDDLSESSKCLRHYIPGNANTIRGSLGAKNWMRKEFQKPEGKKEMVQREQPSPPSTNSTLKPLPFIQPAQVREMEEKQPNLQMTDSEMNALGAKVLKAELLGNHALAAKLKAQLEQAQAARKQRGKASPATTSSNAQEVETIILTRRDSKGFVRPIAAPLHPEPSGGRRRPQKIATHGVDGLRERFFPDDDKYTLENMYHKEKLTTMEDANEEFYRLAAKGAGRTENEYDLDDIFAEKMSREKAPGKLQALERNRAIHQHKRVERSLDSCAYCFDSPRMLKHLMVALGNKVYLSLPAHQSLTKGHCLLAPIHHVSCATQLDDDVWEEITAFRKALVAMFLEQDEDCVFFESAMHLRRFPHMVLQCVPVPREVGDTAPIYFKKAIMESEAEWSMNKKLVDLKGKGVRRAVPKGLPYFAVDFGNDDGFAHVIEDEKLFPENFAEEIIGGVMDLDHSLWRKQRCEKFDTQRKKVLQFAELWKNFDVTKKTEGCSNSSSESDKE